MMKKLFLAILLLGMAPLANSQILISLLLGDKLNSDAIEFGLEGGFNWSEIDGFESSKYKRALNLGFYFDFKLKKQWNLYTGVLVKAKMGTAKLSDKDLVVLEAPTYEAEGDYSQTINYFIVPVFIKYRFKNHFYAEIGPQGGLMYNAWTEFIHKSDNSDVSIRDFNKDKINRIDAGMAVGFGYKLLKGKGFTIGAKYYQGFTNVYKGKSGSQNSGFFLKVNIPIGVGGKEKKEEKG